MSSTKKDNIKENTNQLKENTDRYLEQQRQQFKDTASNISNTTENINESVNKFQADNKYKLCYSCHKQGPPKGKMIKPIASTFETVMPSDAALYLAFH